MQSGFIPNFWLALSLSIITSVANAESVKIGILTDLSGGMASWGHQTRLGAEIAREKIKKGGGNLELHFGDHQLQTKSAVSEFRKLTDINKVQAVYSEFTPTTAAIVSLAKAKKIPIIYTAAATSFVLNSSSIFKSYLDYAEGCKKIGEFWKSRNISNAGILKANLEFGELCSKGIKEVYPNAIEVDFNPGDELSTHVLLLKSKGVEAVVNVSFEPDMINMLKNIKNLNWSPLVAAQDDVIAGETRATYPELLEKITIFSLPPLPSEFLALVTAKDPNNNMISVSAAGLAYLHVKQLHTALVNCKNKPSPCIEQSINSSPPDPTTGFKGYDSQIANFLITLSSAK